MLFLDENTKTVYFFEHFKFDSSKHHKRKGSKYERKQASATRMLNAAQSEALLGVPAVCSIPWGVEISMEMYMSSLIHGFEAHRARVADYKKRFINESDGKPEDWRFFVTFIAEDGSIIGDVDKDRQHVFPNFVKEFMEMFRAQNEVDCLICSGSFGADRRTWCIAKCDQNNANITKLEKSYKNIELKNLNSSTINVSFVPMAVHDVPK